MVGGARNLPARLVVGGGIASAVVVGAAFARLGDLTLVVAALLGLAFVVLVVNDMVGAIAVFIVLSFVEQIPGAGSGVTAIKGAGAVITLAWALGLLRRQWTLQPLLNRQLAFSLSCVALVFWAVDSELWAADAHVALSSASRLAQGVLLAFVIVTCLQDKRALRIAMASFVVGATASALLGLGGVAGASASATSTTATDVRVGGGLGDPNYLAAVIVPALFCTLALHTTTRRRALRVLWVVVGAVLVITLLRTESRGGFVGLAASAAVALVVGGQLRRRILASFGGVILAAAVYFVAFASSSSLHRFIHAGGGSGRSELWGIALNVFRAHPLAGVGLGNFSVVEPTYAAETSANLTKPYQELDLGEVVHNTYLHLLAELGVVGLAVFLCLVVAALVLGWRACRLLTRAGEQEAEILARGLVVGAVGMLAAFFFLTAQYEKQLWIVLALLAVAHVVAQRSQMGARPRDRVAAGG